jgi:hypothetical protein
LLDLLGVALIGIIGAIAIYGIQSKPTGNRVESFLEFINLKNRLTERFFIFYKTLKPCYT